MHCVAAYCTACTPRGRIKVHYMQMHAGCMTSLYSGIATLSASEGSAGHKVMLCRARVCVQIRKTHPRQQLRHRPNIHPKPSCVRQVQGGEYGKTRLWGAVGWGGFSPLGGLLVDRLGERAAFWGNLVGCALGFLPTLLSPVQVQ